MIKKIVVENFLSIKNEAILDMQKGNERVFKENIILKNNLLKSSFIFGPNGAGKTNFELAIKRVRHILLNPTKDIDESLDYSPYIFDEMSQNIPTSVTVEFFNNENIEFKYYVQYNNERFVRETLHMSGEIIFDRVDNDVSISNVPIEKYEYDFSKLRKNISLIWFLQDLNNEIAAAVFTWFKNDLLFLNSSNLDRNSTNEFFASALQDINNDEEREYKFIKYLKASGFNYTGLKVREIAVEVPEKIAETIPKEILEQISKPQTKIFIRQNSYDEGVVSEKNRELPLEYESIGSRAFINTAILLFSNIIKLGNKTVFIDEFGVYLHDQLVRALVHGFNEGNHNNNQFIVNSHNINIMDEYIRFDQIYFMNKNYRGESELYSLYDFDDLNVSGKRHDYGVVKRYLNGKFGSNPSIDTESMISSLMSLNDPSLAEE